MKVDVMKFQNLLDVTVQETGTMENAFEVAAANGKSVSDDIIPGMIIIPDDLIKTANVVNRLSDKRIKPATSVTASEQSASPYGGIGYMKIEYDFIVS